MSNKFQPSGLPKDGLEISDHLGPPRLILDIADGTVAQQIDYDEWGVETSRTNHSFENLFGLTGGLYDQDTGLVGAGFAGKVEVWTGKWMRFETLKEMEPT